jgi:hypothetical protein
LLLYTDTGLHFDNLRTTEDGGGWHYSGKKQMRLVAASCT